LFCPDDLPIAISTVASAIAKGRCDEDVALIAALFVQLGDSLGTILVARACESAKSG